MDEAEKTERRVKANLPATFEEKFSWLGELSVVKTGQEEEDPLRHTGEEEVGEDGLASEGWAGAPRRGREGRRRQRGPAASKLDFHIVGGMFCCKVPGCEEGGGFAGLPDLKEHFDLTHAVTKDPSERRGRRSGRTAKRVRYKEEITDEEEAGDDDEADGGNRTEDEEASPRKGRGAEGEIGERTKGEKRTAESLPKEEKVADQATKRCKPRKREVDLPVDGTPGADANGGGATKDGGNSKDGGNAGSGGDVVHTQRPRSRLFLHCHVCDFSCHNRLDLESHTRTQHPGVDPFKCERCEFTTDQKKYLLSHVRQKHLRAYRCSVRNLSKNPKFPLDTNTTGARNYVAIHVKTSVIGCSCASDGSRTRTTLRRTWRPIPRRTR